MALALSRRGRFHPRTWVLVGGLAGVAAGLTGCADRPALSSADRDAAPPEAPATVSPPETAAVATVDAGAEALLLAYRAAAGPVALDQLQTIRATGVAYLESDKSNRRLVIEAAVPGMFRQYEAPVDAQSRQLLSIVGLKGSDGWRVGTAQLAGDGMARDPEVRQRAVTLAARQNYINAVGGISPWLLRADPAITLTAPPPATEGPDRGLAFVQVTTEDGATGRVYFDPTSALPTRWVAPYQTHIRKQGGEYIMTFSDYRSVGGLRLPFQMVRQDESQRETRWSFSAYTLNPDFGPAEFDRPAR